MLPYLLNHKKRKDFSDYDSFGTEGFPKWIWSVSFKKTNLSRIDANHFTAAADNTLSLSE